MDNMGHVRYGEIVQRAGSVALSALRREIVAELGEVIDTVGAGLVSALGGEIVAEVGGAMDLVSVQ